MRAVVQRVRRAEVAVNAEADRQITGAIEAGFLVLLGVGREDNAEDARLLAEKIAALRVFPDEAGKLGRSLQDNGFSALVVSNFTLYGDCRKGRRPDFGYAAPGPQAESLYTAFVGELKALGVPVQTGVFGADMQVTLINDGPVTLLLDSKKLF